MDTKNTTIEGLPAITAQLVTAEPTAAAAKSVFDPAKFIIISLQGREQVVAFPFEIQHNVMLANIQRKHASVTPISAGIFLGDTETLWAGGESITLELQSRPQDTGIIREFLNSPEPQFNFISGGAK